jgi:hypothetical protein
VSSRPRYQPYLDVPAAPFRWRLGVRPLDLDDWLDLDDEYETMIERKREVMADHPTTAFAVLDDVEAESVEIRDAIVAHLDVLGDPRVPAVDDTLHPLDAAARVVQEDLVFLVERDGGLVCGGGSVCFPNRWDLGSKIGRTMAEIHAPVAQLNDRLETPIDLFFQRLTPERSYWRLGWGVIDTDELYQPTDGTAPPRPSGIAPGAYQLRVERETLRRMPETGCVLFTIRTYICPIGSVPGPDDAALLADAIEAMPTDVAEYKQLDRVGAAVAGWLRRAADESELG